MTTHESRADAGWRWWLRGLGSLLILAYLSGYALGASPNDALLFTGAGLLAGEGIDLQRKRKDIE